MKQCKKRFEGCELRSIELFRSLPKEQIDRVMNQEMVDIEPVFMGFIDTYFYLSKLIPEHFTIFDFGCAYNPQNFYFKNHKKYYAIDVSNCEKFIFQNTIVVNRSIQQFFKEFDFSYVNTKECFAICNYVPDWYNGGKELISEKFPNVFAYYPHGGFDIRKEIFGEK